MLAALREARALGVSRGLLATGRASVSPAVAYPALHFLSPASAATHTGRHSAACSRTRTYARSCIRALSSPAVGWPQLTQAPLARQRLPACGCGSSSSALAGGGARNSSSSSSSGRAANVTAGAVGKAGAMQHGAAVAQDAGAAAAAPAAGLARVRGEGLCRCVSPFP